MKNTNMKAIRRSVQLSGKILLLGFVLFIFSGIAYSQTNLARGKITGQSSTFGSGGDSSRAVDGIRDGNFFRKSVTHTNEQKMAYWYVDLGAVYNIRQIKIYNRTDCCQERLKDFRVVVSDKLLSSTVRGTPYGYINSTNSNPIILNGNQRGRYVTIYKNATGILSLAEVEVYGTPATATTNSPANNRTTNARTSRNLSGNWAGYFKDGRKSAYVWAINQNGSTLSIQGVGQFANLKSRGSLRGNQISATDFKTRGTISSDGRTIRWTDGVTWRKISSVPSRTDTTPRTNRNSNNDRTSTPRTNRNSNTQITGTRASREQQCFSLIQNKVAYDKNGNKRWHANNIRALCNQTTNPAGTVACFKSELNRYGNWNWARASQVCQNRFRGTNSASNNRRRSPQATILNDEPESFNSRNTKHHPSEKSSGIYGIREKIKGLLATPEESKINGTYSTKHLFDTYQAGIDHVGGIAQLSDGRYVLSHSTRPNKDKALIVVQDSSKRDTKFILVGRGNHAGAIQATGKVVVVPIYGGDLSGSELVFIDARMPDQPKVLDHLRFEEAHKLNAAGIVFHEKEKVHYLITTRKTDYGLEEYQKPILYKSNGLSLFDKNCKFERVKSADGTVTDGQIDVFTSQGGTQLIYDSNTEELFVLALYRTEKDDEDETGVEKVALSKIDPFSMTATLLEDKELSDSGSWLDYSPGFRWGGTIATASDGKLSVVGVHRTLTHGPLNQYTTLRVWKYSNLKEYKITVKTGTSTGAGTDSNIYLKICGNRGCTSEFVMNPLTKASNAFENGDTDYLTKRNVDVGKITRIEVRSDTKYAGSDWLLESITIEGPENTKSFKINAWIEDKRTRKFFR